MSYPDKCQNFMTMDKNPVIEVDLDKRCVRCKKRGATPCGLCLACAFKALKEADDADK